MKPKFKPRSLFSAPPSLPQLEPTETSAPCATCGQPVRIEAACRAADGRLYHQRCKHPDEKESK